MPRRRRRGAVRSRRHADRQRARSRRRRQRHARSERGLRAAAATRALRPMVGSGARGMVGVGFGLTPDDAGYFERCATSSSRRYEARMTQRDTRVRRRCCRCCDALRCAAACAGASSPTRRRASPSRWSRPRSAATRWPRWSAATRRRTPSRIRRRCSKRRAGCGCRSGRVRLRRRRPPRRRGRAGRRHAHRRRRAGAISAAASRRAHWGADAVIAA